jgi:hypothetical protein
VRPDHVDDLADLFGGAPVGGRRDVLTTPTTGNPDG